MVGGPLAGQRVIDFTRFVSGSYATGLLATLGAEVIKVEPLSGDPYRVQGTGRVGNESALFLSLNSGKRSLALDFRTGAGRDVLDRLLAGADFFVENARPGSLAAHRLDWPTVHEDHPWIIYGSISGYGDVGPDATKGGFDLILQAESGVMSVTGSPSSGPVKVGAPLLDVGAGLSCALGLLAAHVERLTTGTGSVVASSLLEFALAGLGTVAAESLASGEIPGLLGTHSPTFAPYGGFRTADGWLVMAGAGSEDLWQRACRAIGVEELVDDPRFADNAARVGRRDELSELLEKSLSSQTTERWLERLAAAGVPAARVQDLGAVLASEQVAALGVVQHLDHHQAGPYAVPRAPIRFGGQPARYPGPAPMLGADTRAVLEELGMTPAEIEALLDAGVVAAP